MFRRAFITLSNELEKPIADLLNLTCILLLVSGFSLVDHSREETPTQSKVIGGITMSQILDELVSTSPNRRRFLKSVGAATATLGATTLVGTSAARAEEV